MRIWIEIHDDNQPIRHCNFYVDAEAVKQFTIQLKRQTKGRPRYQLLSDLPEANGVFHAHQPMQRTPT